MSNFKGTAELFAGQIEITKEANAAAADIDNAVTYMQDGLLYCAVCHEPKQKNVPCIGTVFIPCGCDRQREEARKRTETTKEIERRRLVAFGSTNSIKLRFTFERDDQRNPLASQMIKTYCDQFRQHQENGKGLLLYSAYNGSGKTFFASAAANALIDGGYSVRVTKFADLRDEMIDYKSFGHLNRVDFLRKLCANDLIVIDDLGAENDTQYTAEIEYRIIDELTDNHIPLIITTNYTPAELDKETNRTKKRINDRILGNCIPIKISQPTNGAGKPVSRRIEQCEKNLSDFLEQMPPTK